MSRLIPAELALPAAGRVSRGGALFPVTCQGRCQIGAGSSR
jgi:hypothetical protein